MVRDHHRSRVWALEPSEARERAREVWMGGKLFCGRAREEEWMGSRQSAKYPVVAVSI